MYVTIAEIHTAGGKKKEKWYVIFRVLTDVLFLSLLILSTIVNDQLKGQQGILLC